MADKTRKGRQARGGSHPQAKLTWAAVRFIRQEKRLSTCELASIFGVTRETIQRARNGKCWVTAAAALAA